MKCRLTHRATSYIVCLASLLLTGSSVSATVYRCTDARDEAILGTNGSVNSSHGDRKCRWSVNGASIESRAAARANSQQQNVLALNNLMRGAFDRLDAQSMRSFVELTMGPFQGGGVSVSVGFENAFRSSANQLSSCISSRGKATLNSSTLICQMIAPEGGDRTTNVWAIEVTPTEPLLVMGAAFGEQRYMLFMPQRYFFSTFRFQ